MHRVRRAVIIDLIVCWMVAILATTMIALGLLNMGGCQSTTKITPAHTQADRVTTTTGPSHKRTVTIFAAPAPANPCGQATEVRP